MRCNSDDVRLDIVGKIHNPPTWMPLPQHDLAVVRYAKFLRERLEFVFRIFTLRSRDFLWNNSGHVLRYMGDDMQECDDCIRTNTSYVIYSPFGVCLLR